MQQPQLQTIPYNADVLKKSFQFDENWFLLDDEIKNILEKNHMPTELIHWYLECHKRIKNNDNSSFIGYLFLCTHRWVDTRDEVDEDIQNLIKSCNFSSLLSSLPQLQGTLLAWYAEIREYSKKFNSLTEFEKKKDEVLVLLQHRDSLIRLAWIMKYTSQALSLYIYHTNSMINELNQTFKTDIMKLLAQENDGKDTGK